MYKVGVCGHFGEGKQLSNGQTVKTRLLTDELKLVFGSEEVKTVDTHSWMKNPFLLILRCFWLMKKCENIIILPAHNGVKIFVPLFLIFGVLFHRKLHYVVIGGWLPELLQKNKKLRAKVSKFDGIYVETHSMKNTLKNLGLDNVLYLPNFKRLNILDEESIHNTTMEPYKLCTFSRVMKEKGIEEAITSVITVNETLGRTVYKLDIYGQVEEEYVERFEQLKKDFPSYISYKGIVNYNESVEVLKEYFALLFPTHYEGEGFAGTILDAFAAGVPVIATNWRYNSEIINDKSDGLLYDYNNNLELNRILFDIHSNPTIVNNMRKNCLKQAKKFTPEVVVNSLIKHL